MKKILHIFKIEKFTAGFISFINKNFSKDSHTFWIHGDKNPDEEYNYLAYSNIYFYPNMEIKLNKNHTEKQLEDFDLIVYHWIIDIPIIDYFYFHKKILKKLILYFWGGDDKLFGNFWEKMRKRHVIRHALVLGRIIPEEIVEMRSRYRPKGKLLCAMYDDDKLRDILNNMQIIQKKTTDPINIQIGNSAYSDFNHIRILKLLSKYKEDNIKIYAPLSYGKMDYAEQVIRYGRKIYGDKFIPMQQFLPAEDYYDFLQKMDIAIMDLEGQHALGNIYGLLRLGCKLYLRKNSMLYKYFLKEMHCKIFTIDQIENMDINELSRFDYHEKEKNRKHIFDHWNEQILINQWKQIFNIIK